MPPSSSAITPPSAAGPSRSAVRANAASSRRRATRRACSASTRRWHPSPRNENVPELVFVPPRFDVYRAVSRQIHAIFERYTPLMQPLSLDEAHLDVTAPLIDLGSATAIAREIKRLIKRGDRPDRFGRRVL